MRGGELTYSQYIAVIILLYKKGVREDIGNWRPISLINIDCKLLSKVFAQRVKHVLPFIISTDQKGCIQGRLIGQNIRLIEDVINEMDDENVVLLLDQQKAFDRVEWDWLFSVLHAFDFGEKFISWIRIMYKNMKSAVTTNGYVSSYFPVTRGIRQGDCLSALLYIIQAEPLAEYIRKSDTVRGIEIKDHNGIGHELKCADYVDDSMKFMFEKNDAQECLKIVDDFGKASGSSLNRDKTVGLSNDASNTRQNQYSIHISNGPEKCLGIQVGKIRKNDQFWENIITRIEKKLNLWKLRNLSLIGKVHIVKSVGLSIAMYGCEMTDISDKHVIKIMKLIWEFIWENKKVHVKKIICMLPRNLGGLGIPNFEAIVKVRRVKMLVNILLNDDKWNILARKHVRCLDKLYDIDWFSLRVTDSTDEIRSSNIPEFYKNCILAFQELCRKGKVLGDEDQIIWCNHCIRFRGKVLNLRHWSKSGLVFVSDILDGNDISTPKILNKLRNRAGYVFELQRVKKGLENYVHSTSLQNQRNDGSSTEAILQTKFKIPKQGKKSLSDLNSQDMYNIFMFHENVEIPSKGYWDTKYPNIDFEFIVKYLFMSKILSRKCQVFNWRIFHGLSLVCFLTVWDLILF